MLLGENFFPLLVLAFGGGLAVGTIAALIKGDTTTVDESSEPTQIGPWTISNEKAMKLRSILLIVVGIVMSTWAIATITSS